MLQSFQHKGLRQLYELGHTKLLPAPYLSKIENMLGVIDQAETVDEIGVFPGWRLHELKGKFKGYWSITVSGNWRITFRFEDGDAFDLDFVDFL
jgi:proteic killer suppression protein